MLGETQTTAANNILPIRVKFRELIAQRAEADELALALLTNPRVRELGETIYEVADILRRSDEMLCNVVTEARRIYPSPLHPWNRREYDKYQRVAAPATTATPNTVSQGDIA